MKHILIFTIFLVFSFTSASEENGIWTECDELASPKENIFYIGNRVWWSKGDSEYGISIRDIDYEIANIACIKSVKKYPNIARYK